LQDELDWRIDRLSRIIQRRNGRIFMLEGYVKMRLDEIIYKVIGCAI